jgi:hypothetical protein
MPTADQIIIASVNYCPETKSDRPAIAAAREFVANN